jgi:hypothetical protein
MIQEVFYLSLEGQYIFPITMVPETTADDQYEFNILAGRHTLSEQTGDDYAIGCIRNGSTTIQRVERLQPMQDYPKTTFDDDYLICVSFRPSEEGLRMYYFTPKHAQLTSSINGKYFHQPHIPRRVDHQLGDYIIWIGKGDIYNICRQKPFEPDDIKDLKPHIDYVPQSILNALPSLLPKKSHLLKLLTNHETKQA